MTGMTDEPDVATYARKFNMWSVVGAGIWLVFLAPTVREGWRAGGWAGILGVVVTVVFAVCYLAVFVWARPRRQGGQGPMCTHLQLRPVLAWLGLGLLSLVDVLLIGSAGLATCVYLSVAGILLLPTWISVVLGLVIAGGTELLARTVPGWDGADGIGLSVFLATFAVWGMFQAMRRSMQLAESRHENAELLVSQERSRMARDLHDILGHSLTVITVKAELAGRLLDADTEAGRERARAEVADLERLSRDALADVRRTVEGYRDLSLPVEITRARVALEAAEIEATLPGTTDEVPTEWRELFAWTLREAVTNVVRHSAARHCTVTLTPDRIRVVDDGRGCEGAVADGGNGLVGLRERAAAVGARVVVEAPPAGGFSLSVITPAAAPTARPTRGDSESGSDPSADAPSATGALGDTGALVRTAVQRVTT